MRRSKAEPEFNRYKARGLALAVPEVPLAARDELLECATRYGFLRAASFTSAEMRDSSVPAMLNKTDLLVINRDEAASLASADAGASMERLAGKAVEHLTSIQPAIWAIMTAGREGSWAWDGRELAHLPALKVEAVNAAGAGDAFFAGVLAGLASGLALTEAQQVGNLCGAFSTTSPDTINHALDRASLARLAEQTHAALTGRAANDWGCHRRQTGTHQSSINAKETSHENFVARWRPGGQGSTSLLQRRRWPWPECCVRAP